MNDTNKKDEYLLSRRRAFIRAGFYAFVLLLVTGLIVTVLTLNGKLNRLAERISKNEAAIQVYNENSSGTTADNNDGTIYFYDSVYGSMWIKDFVNMPDNSFDYSNLSFADSRYTYGENSAVGIDVSYHQGDIEWQKVADDGIDFAILRLGYRGYESNLIKEDERFDEYLNGAENAGLDVGVYFYSHAKSTAEATEEADFVISRLEGKDITYPVVFDWEATVKENADAANISPEELTEYADAFCTKIAQAGYTPMIYGSGQILMCKFDLDKLSKYKFWYAQYRDGETTPDFRYNFDIWQYASDGNVDGIDGDVDMNICFNAKEQKK